MRWTTYAMVGALALATTACNAVLGIGKPGLGDDGGVGIDAASDGPRLDAALVDGPIADAPPGDDARPVDAGTGGVDAAPGPLSLSGGLTTVGPVGNTTGTIRLVDTGLEGAATACAGAGASRICLTGGLTP